MLSKPSENVAECYRYALECAEKAKWERDPRSRQDFLDAERRWLFLARSYEFAEQLESFQQQ